MPSLNSPNPASQDAKDVYFTPVGQSAKMTALVGDVLRGLHDTKRQVGECLSITPNADGYAVSFSPAGPKLST